MDDRRPDDGEEGPDVAEQRLSDVARTRITAKRAKATQGRELTARLRDQAARERDLLAQQRDESSIRRDEAAEGRDAESTDLDAKDNLNDTHTLRLSELRGRGRASRRRAADDRAQAGRDRLQATGDRILAGSDREQAGSDREQAAYDREHSGTDELTGARRRGVGLEELDNEMKRARRESYSLIVAYVDVDALKSVNDERGHAAGDAVLRAVADGFRRHMRPYDLFVRLGGDEFLCALPHVTLPVAQARFDELLAELEDAGGGSVSIGYSELRDGDSVDDFVSRADSALLAHRR